MSSFRRKLAIAIAICAIVSSGVSGFTAVTADRSTSVEIATQTSAYISFDGELNVEITILLPTTLHMEQHWVKDK